jgi:hypothetical protein
VRRRRRRQLLTPRRLSVVGAVLGLLVVLLVAGVASREGDYTTALPTTAPTSSAAIAAPTRPTAPPPATATPTATQDPQSDLPPSPVLGRALLVLLALLALGAGGALVTSLVRSTRELARSGALTPPRAAGTAVREALAPATADALLAVEQPDARDAVVRSWLLLGDAAATAGLPARPAETAAEYAARIAAELDVPGTELDRLADLYREARFSRHEVGEPQRAAARELLHRLRDRLARVRA